MVSPAKSVEQKAVSSQIGTLLKQGLYSDARIAAEKVDEEYKEEALFKVAFSAFKELPSDESKKIECLRECLQNPVE